MRVWHNVPLQIVGPDERVIYSGERESSGKYTFAAHIDGVYKYCFGNQMSSMTPKIVMFSMEVGEAPKDHMEGDGRLSLSLTHTHTHTHTLSLSLFLSLPSLSFSLS